jgi:hypothetical protein
MLDYIWNCNRLCKKHVIKTLGMEYTFKWVLVSNSLKVFLSVKSILHNRLMSFVFPIVQQY